MAKIFFMLGKSCSGKDTIFKKLKEDRELNRLHHKTYERRGN